MATQMAEAEFGAPRFGQNLRVGLPCSMFLSVFWGGKFVGPQSWQEFLSFPWHSFPRFSTKAIFGTTEGIQARKARWWV